MNDLPLVTIAIPTYNRVEYLKQALASAQAQTYPNLEIIVSDNASSDGTQAFMNEVMDKRVRYVRQSDNLGMVGNWNACLGSTKGDYFLLLSDDDLLLSTCISDLIDEIQKQTEPFEVGCIFGQVKYICEGENKTKTKTYRGKQSYTRSEAFEAYFNLGLPTYACAGLFALKNVQYRYEEKFKYLFDANFWMNSLKNSKKIVFSRKIVAYYRIHDNSETKKSIHSDWINDTLLIIDFQKDLLGHERYRNMKHKFEKHKDFFRILEKKDWTESVIFLLKNYRYTYSKAIEYINKFILTKINYY